MRNSSAGTCFPPHSRPLFDIARPQGQHRRKAKSPAEAGFTCPNQNCYTVANKQESFVSTGLRNECCAGYWMTGIEYAIGTLKKAKRIKKVGSKRFGHWEVGE